MKFKIQAKFLILLLVGGMVISCHQIETNSLQKNRINTRSLNDYSIQTVLWQQTAGEYKALCHQAYNLAKLRLEKLLREKSKGGKSMAIITDIDETVLDNSPYNAKLITTGKSYKRETWIEWGNTISAKAVPGSLAFFKFANENGVEVYYISDRYQAQENETLENLRKLGFPNADKAHILLKSEGVDKETRRKKVMDSTNVIMYLGDNLSDFSVLFDAKEMIERNRLEDSLQQNFGNKFIVLPNPMYGAWLTNDIYKGKYDWSAAQKDSLLRANLKGY